jgi:hypothetical protein
VFKQCSDFSVFKGRNENLTEASDSELRMYARQTAEGKLSFYIHLAVYAVSNLLIFLMWRFTGGLYVFMVPWFVFPLVFWGAGIVVHYLCVWTPYAEMGYIERQTEREYQKLKKLEEERAVQTVSG